jgi:hypothetical protein
MYSTQPAPLNVTVKRPSDGLAVVNLTFKKADKDACHRCDLCRAKPGPTRGQAMCTNEMPAAAVEGFVWGSGSRVDRAASTPAPKPAEPRKPRRGRGKMTTDQWAGELRASVAAEMASESAPDPYPDHPEKSDAEGQRRRDRTDEAVGRLEQAVVGVHGEHVLHVEAFEAVGIETEDHIVVTIPPEIIEWLSMNGALTIAVYKANIAKLTESKAK